MTTTTTADVVAVPSNTSNWLYVYYTFLDRVECGGGRQANDHPWITHDNVVLLYNNNLCTLHYHSSFCAISAASRAPSVFTEIEVHV